MRSRCKVLRRRPGTWLSLLTNDTQASFWDPGQATEGFERPFQNRKNDKYKMVHPYSGTLCSYEKYWGIVNCTIWKGRQDILNEKGAGLEKYYILYFYINTSGWVDVVKKTPREHTPSSEWSLQPYLRPPSRHEAAPGRHHAFSHPRASVLVPLTWTALPLLFTWTVPYHFTLNVISNQGPSGSLFFGCCY